MQYLDTRDLYKRQCELRKEKEALEQDLEEKREELAAAKQEYQDAREEDKTEENEDAMDEAQEDFEAAQADLATWIEENQEELDELNGLEKEVSEWMHGNTMIPESEWVSYVQDLADDLGAVGDSHSWLVIDWEATADGVRMDYHEVKYQGVTYLVRD